MSGEDWDQIAGIAAEAAEIDPAERASFLAERCGGSAELRAEIESLLCHQRTEGPLAHAPFAVSAYKGRLLGPWRLLAEIGRGGMGVVYRAERADGQFTREVAVKLINTPIPTPAALEHFTAERHLLARLSHPNIAGLLDAGVTADSVPYLVMELVEGEPITEYCRRRELTLRQKAGLMCLVCDAVGYAHQQLVIHRDLKPGNIFVTADGRPKLLDFGVARMITPSLASNPTSSMLRAVTPDYASPELIRGEPVSTASDIYSLGVLLYELLTGEVPLRLRDLPLAEALDVVTAAEPQAPPGAGDLGAIAAKALAKQPSERYSSVEAFAGDMERFLAGRPVTAAPAGRWDRLRKFVARNRIASASVAVAVAALLAGSGLALWQAHAAGRARQAADHRYEEVRQLANRVIFDYQRQLATIGAGTALRARMVVDSLRYLDRLAATGPASARLQTEIALAYMQLGLAQYSPNASLGDRKGALESYGRAEAQLRRALDLDPAYLPAQKELAEVQCNLSRLDPARTQPCVDSWSRLYRLHPSDSRVLNGLARAWFFASLSQPERSAGRIDNLKRALDLYQTQLVGKMSDETLRNLALCHKYLSSSYGATGDLESAHRHAVAAVDFDSKRAASSSTPAVLADLSTSYGTLAWIHERRGQLADSLPIRRRNLDLRKQVLASDRDSRWYQSSLVQAFSRLVTLQNNLGRNADASASCLEAALLPPMTHLQAPSREVAALHLACAVAFLRAQDTRRFCGSVLRTQQYLGSFEFANPPDRPVWGNVQREAGRRCQ